MKKIVLIFLLASTLCSPAFALEPWQIESYTKRVFKNQVNQCVPMGEFAADLAIKDGYTVRRMTSTLKNGKSHRWLILEKADKDGVIHEYKILKYNNAVMPGDYVYQEGGES